MELSDRHDETHRHAGDLPVASFIGRDRELVEIELLLDDPALDVVVLLGEAGVGKSRLAQEVVHRWQRRADGLDPSYRTRRLVLIDDAHRFVLDERDRLVDRARAAENTIVLLTDRRNLTDAGARQYPIGPLECPADYSALDIEGFCRIPAVELFIAMRRLSQPSFAVDATNQGSIARLCAYLRGVPLHLQVASRLLTDVDVGVVGSPGAVRSATLVALLQRGVDPAARYDVLSIDERRVLGTATLFVGGFGQEALEAVTGIDSLALAGLVEGLLAQNLLVRTNSTSAGVSGLVGMRCHLPITALPIARATLVDGGHNGGVDPVPAAELHTEYYLDVLSRGLEAIDGPDQLLGLTLLLVERGNLDAALARLQVGPDPGRVVDAVRGLRRYWRAVGLVFEVRDRLEALIGREDALDVTRRRQLNLALADAEAVLGEPEMAAESLRRASGPSTGVTPGEAAELDATRALLELTCDDPAGPARLRRAGTALRAAGRTADADAAVLMLAMHTMLGRQAAAAAELCDSVLAAARRRGDHLTSAGALLRLCVCHVALDDVDRAAEYYARGLGHLRDLGFAVTLGQLAQILGSSMIHDITARAAHVTELLGAMSQLRDEMSAGPEEPTFIVGTYQERMRRVLGLAEFTNALQRGIGRTPFELLSRFAERVRIEMPVVTPILLRHDTPSVGAAVTHDLDAWHRLTPRERAVALLVAEGMSNKQVARTLSISDWTVVNHMRAVLRKLECRSRVQVTRWVLDHSPTSAEATAVVIETALITGVVVQSEDDGG